MRSAIIAETAKNAKFADIVENARIAEIARIADTEIVRFLKTFKTWFFSEKIDVSFKEKLEFYTKSLKVANLL